MKFFVLLILTSVFLSGCIAGKGDVKIDVKRKQKAISASNIQSASVSSVQIINHQLVITGTGLTDVINVKVDGSSLDESFSIESKTATQIVANSLKTFSFDISKVFNLILSDANASATFPIDFSLCNATLNGKGFDCGIAASDKDVLSYDQATNKWKPRSINGLSYQGSWDADDPLPVTNSPGDYFIVSNANAPYGVGDWIVWNGGHYDQINNSNTITSVFGRTGAVVATEGDYDLNKLFDVDLSIAPTNGKVLKYNGTKWVAADDLSGGGAGSVTGAEIADDAVTDVKIDSVSASKITGTITSAQIADGTIVNADINAAAAIDYSKLNIPNTTIPYAKLNIADGDIPAAKISGLPSMSSVLATTIVDADTTHAPDGNAVFDALGLKLNTTGGTLTVGTISGVPTPMNSDDVANKGYTDTRDALKLAKVGDTMSGILTLDSDLKIKGGENYVTVKGHATSTAYDLILPINKGTSGYVLATDGNGNTSWVDVTTAVTSLDTDDVAEGSKLYFTEVRVLATDLAGLNTGIAGPVAAADTVLGAMGKLQYQVTDLKGKGQWEKSASDIYYSAGDVQIDKNLKLKDSGTNYVQIKAPATVGATYTLTMPINDGDANQVLKTDGAGVLAWVDVNDTTVQSFAKAALPACNAGEVLKSNGTSFSCVVDNSGAGAFSGTANKAVITSADGTLDVSATSATELGYVAGVTSSIQTQLNGKQATDATLTALAGFNTNGIMVQTAADTFVGRSITGTTNRVTVTNGDGVAANPTVNISTTLLPSPVVGDVGTFLKATAADTSLWSALDLSDITTALGFTPVNKAGDSITSGTFTFSGTAALRANDPVVATDVANKQYVDGYGQWTKNGSDIYRASGKVGVGTTTPTTPLHVVAPGDTGLDTVIKLEVADSSDYVLLQNNAGAGGIFDPTFFGVTPRAGGFPLAFVGAVTTGNDTGTAALVSFQGRVGTELSGTAVVNRDLFNFSNYSTSVMRILANGNVGIGTTTPKSKLDVNGAIRVGVDATACSATIAGAMRFNTPNVEFCNGTTWAAFGTSGAAVVSAQITDGTIVDADVNAAANITATKLGTGVVDNTEFNYLNGVTSSIQTQLNGKQTTDATLTALAGFNTNGIMVQTAADTFIGRSIAGTANRVTVTNGDGVAANPTVNISTTLLPSPVVGDVGKFLKATAADTSAWTALGSTDITTALGFTPINKAGDSLTTGTITLSGAALLRTPDPIGPTDVANKQYVDSYGQWIKNGSDVYRSIGSVGIGTSTPAAKTEISSAGTTLVTGLRVNTVGTPTIGSGAAVELGSSVNNSGSFSIAKIASFLIDGGSGVEAGHMILSTIRAGVMTEAMRILNNGNVGIGTTNPTAALDVNGDIKASGRFNGRQDALNELKTVMAGACIAGSGAQGGRFITLTAAAGDTCAAACSRTNVNTTCAWGTTYWATGMYYGYNTECGTGVNYQQSSTGYICCCSQTTNGSIPIR